MRLPKALAAWGVIALWLPYAALNTLFPGPTITYTLGLALAALGLALLALAGVPPRDCFVQAAPLSWRGALLLVPPLLMLPVALVAGRLQPWRPLDDLVYAPASALAQELYFRAGLLAALTAVSRPHGKRVAVIAQSLLFGVWHLRAFSAVPFLPAAGILVATAIAGLLWGLQAQRDRTMLYAAAEHALLLALV